MPMHTSQSRRQSRSLRNRMYQRLRRVCAYLVLLLLPWQLQAQNVDLFHASVPVATQDPKQLQVALGAALAQVIVKVSGQASVLQSGAIQSAIKQPNRFVLQFGYEKAPASADAVPGLHLVANFQSEAVRQLLRTNNLPVWPVPRPDVLVWLVVDDAGSRAMVGGDKHADMVQALREAAANRGVSIVLPMQDLEDNMALGENELWNLQRVAVEKASKRYSKDTILYGRITLTDGKASGSWQLLHRGDALSFEGAPADIAQYMQTGVDRIAESLAMKYAVVTRAGAGGVTTLIIEGLNSYADFAQSQAYLQRTESISALNLVTVEGSTAVYTANVSDIAQLQQMLSLDRRLRASDSTDPAQPSTVYLRWTDAP